jgi:hypothetical protein
MVCSLNEIAISIPNQNVGRLLLNWKKDTINPPENPPKGKRIKYIGGEV